MDMKFICECGKEFSTLRALGSHGGHCKLYKPRVKTPSKYKCGDVYKCECGKEFSNSQSLNAHLSHCDIHHQVCGTEKKVRLHEVEHKMCGWDNKTKEELQEYSIKAKETITNRLKTDDEFFKQYHSGHKHSEESKRKIGEGRRKAIEEGRGNKWIPPHIQPSYPEQYFINVFNDNGVKFENNFFVYPYTLDFAWIDKKIYIEIDGEQHYTKYGLERDLKRTEYLKEKGWILLKRIRWSEFKKLNDSEKEAIIKDLLDNIK